MSQADSFAQSFANNCINTATFHDLTEVGKKRGGKKKQRESRGERKKHTPHNPINNTHNDLSSEVPPRALIS